MICNLCGEPIASCICKAAGLPPVEEMVSEPGAPPPSEVRKRAAVVFARMRDLAGVFARVRYPVDDTTACAAIVLGVATLCRPTSKIDPKHVDALLAEMASLGKIAARMMAIRARMQGKN